MAAVSSIAIFYTLQYGSFYQVILSMMILAVVAGNIAGPANAYMGSLFPTRLRFTGVAFGYGIGSAVLGGTLPMVAERLIQYAQNPIMPGYYLSCISCIGLIILIGPLRRQVSTSPL